MQGKVEEQILATEAAEAEADDLRKLLKEKENDLEQLHRANLDQKQKFKVSRTLYVNQGHDLYA